MLNMVVPTVPWKYDGWTDNLDTVFIDYENSDETIKGWRKKRWKRKIKIIREEYNGSKSNNEYDEMCLKWVLFIIWVW